MNTKTEKKEIELLDFWRIAIKRKWIVVSVVAVLLIVAGVSSFTKTRLYDATATILIEEPGSNMLNIEEMFNMGPYYRYDMLGVYFNTQLKLLTSRSLAERVARKMNLQDRPELQERHGLSINPFRTVRKFLSLRWIMPRRKPQAEELEPEFRPGQDPNSAYAFMVLGGLSVVPVEETRLVSVSFTSPHPVLSADVVNTVVEEFINYSVEMRYEATQQASEFLSEQISQLREDLASKEKEIQKYGEEKKLLYLDDKESTVLSKFAELNTAFTQAQIDRIKAEASYRELKDLRIDSLPQYVNNTLIQNLKTEYSRINNEYNEKIKVFKPDYPDMIKLRARLDSMKNELESEIEKAVEASRSEYRANLKKEESLGSLLEDQRLSVAKMNNNAILYNSLKIEVENKRTLLNSLVAKQNETLVSARLKGLKTSNIKIIDRALVPGGAASPNTSRNMTIALLLGLFLGVGLAFFMEYLDNTVKSPEDAEKLVDLPSLGIIPFISPNGMKGRPGYYSPYSHSYGKETAGEPGSVPELKEVELINHQFPHLSISEDYRTLRTSILFSHADSTPKAISFTSAFPQEGKTATVVNTAVSFAQLEKKVILIDADLRKPRLHKIFKVRNLQGLSSYLTGKISLKDAIQKTSVDNLWIISSGPHPPNPAELLESRKMKEVIGSLKEMFDVILLDSPPVLAVIDPLIICALVDGAVLVVRAGKTTRKGLTRAVVEVTKSKAQIIGLVFNEMKIKRGSGYYSPDYHGYLDSYYEEK